jgi:nucleotide-binding universal stress UspA family protein
MNGVFRRILVPTDFSPCAGAAWRLAQRIAAALGSELIVAHVFVEGSLWSESPFNMARVRELFANQQRRAESVLDEWAAEARAAGLTVGTVIRNGIPHDEIVVLASQKDADLIAIGTHGRGGVSRALLGSVADRVVRLASCPVLTVHEGS